MDACEFTQLVLILREYFTPSLQRTISFCQFCPGHPLVSPGPGGTPSLRGTTNSDSLPTFPSCLVDLLAHPSLDMSFPGLESPGLCGRSWRKSHSTLLKISVTHLSLFPSSHVCDKDRWALCQAITTVMRCQHCLCSCENSLASSTSQCRPALLPLPHSSSSPSAALLYLGLGRGCCICIPLPGTCSDDTRRLCSWGPENSQAAGHSPAPEQKQGSWETLAGVEGCATTAPPWKGLPPGADLFPEKLGKLGRWRTQKGRCVREKTFALWLPDPFSQV